MDEKKRRNTTRVESTHKTTVSIETHSEPTGCKERTTCNLCGTEFTFFPSNKKGLYCAECVQNESWRNPPSLSGSENPRWNGGKRIVPCDRCGETVERYPSNIGETVLCSEECRRQWLSRKFSGAGHPNWKGGPVSPYGTGWNRVRKLALERDGYECRRCGISKADLGQNPDVHHIVSVRWFDESSDHDKADAHTLDNVISLCLPCHRKAEAGDIPHEKLRSLQG